MKTKSIQFLTISLFIIVLIGCSGVSQSDYNALKAENEKLKVEIQDLKFGPDKLLNQAKGLLDNKEFAKAETVLKTLLQKHQGSEQVTEAKSLLTVAEKGIKEQKLVEEKEKRENARKEKERLANATKKLSKKYDDINETTWYRDRTSPAYVNYNGFYAYIGQSKGSKPWLRLAIQYAAEDWLFIKSYTIKVDNQTYEISENSYNEIKTDNGEGGIWEWLDRQVTSSEYKIIKAVAFAKNAKIRFEGKDYHKDKIINEQQITALRNILDAYEALGGNNL